MAQSIYFAFFVCRGTNLIFFKNPANYLCSFILRNEQWGGMMMLLWSFALETGINKLLSFHVKMYKLPCLSLETLSFRQSRVLLWRVKHAVQTQTRFLFVFLTYSSLGLSTSSALNLNLSFCCSLSFTELQERQWTTSFTADPKTHRCVRSLFGSTLVPDNKVSCLYGSIESITQQSCSNILSVYKQVALSRASVTACGAFQFGYDCTSSDCSWGLGCVKGWIKGEGGVNINIREWSWRNMEMFTICSKRMHEIPPSL